MNQLQRAKWLRLRCPKHEDFTAVIGRDEPELKRCPACRCAVELIFIATGFTRLELPAFFLKDGERWFWNGPRKRQKGAKKGAVTPDHPRSAEYNPSGINPRNLALDNIQG